MQTARIAAMRGHDVTLFEKGPYLGGSLPLAAMVKGFEVEDIPSIIRFFKGQLRKLGVDVRLSTEFTPSDIDRIRPDVVVLALGGIPTLPDVPGIDGRNVIKSADLYGMLRFFIRFLGPKRLRFLTKIWMPVGKKRRYSRRRYTGLPARRIPHQTGQEGCDSRYRKGTGQVDVSREKNPSVLLVQEERSHPHGGVKLEKITPARPKYRGKRGQ